MEHVTNQKQVERQILELVKTYNVLYKRQIYAFFAVDGKEKFVGKAHAHVIERTFVYITKSQKLYPNMKMPISCREKRHIKSILGFFFL